jgi:hypothetical protein
VLSCFDADTGEEQYVERLGARFRASPSLVGDRVFLVSEAGEGMVLSSGRQFERVGGGSFDEPVYSTASFAHGRTYVRGTESVVCVGGE